MTKKMRTLHKSETEIDQQKVMTWALILVILGCILAVTVFAEPLGRLYHAWTP